MPVEVIFPKVDMDMESGELVQWMCKSGDLITEGSVLFVIETDKSGMEIEAAANGKIAIVDESVGVQYQVGSVLAYIYDDSEDYIAHDEMERINAFGNRASPAARRLAKQHGLQLDDMTGTAHLGRIVKQDVVAVIDSLDRNDSAQVETATTKVTVATDSTESIRHSSMRKAIAKRLTESVNQIPSYDIFIECNCSSLLCLKSEVNGSDQSRAMGSDVSAKVSINDMFIKALALTLRDRPMANSSWTDSERIVHSAVDIGMAVALDDGLITPIIRSADTKTLMQISVEAKELAKRAVNGSLDKSEYQGGVSTVSNLGMYGIPGFTSIINPPQASILSIGAVTQIPVYSNDEITVAPMCKITFSFDHRLIDGAYGAVVANTFKDYVENAVRLVI